MFYFDSVNDPDSDWHTRPWQHEIGIIFPVDLKEINIDHDAAMTPRLPGNITVPSPFLPTNNITVMALYHLAIDTFEADERKTKNQRAAELVKKRNDMRVFNDMNLCWHRISFCNGFGEKAKRLFKGKAYGNQYHAKKRILEDEMKVVGLTNLGKDLDEYMAKTGQKI